MVRYGPILNFGEITNDKEVRKLIKEFSLFN